MAQVLTFLKLSLYNMPKLGNRRKPLTHFHSMSAI